MKKNSTMRVAALLLALTLMTSCFVGGTFAKYTTAGTATDTARVAKWGVEVVADGSHTFGGYYFNKVNGNTLNTSYTFGTDSVASVGGKVVAPGTKGTVAGLTINGQPEVDTKVSFTVDITLNNWNVDSHFYCPLVIAVNGEEINGVDYIDNMAGFITAIQDKVVSHTEFFAANTPIDDDALSITWEWPFETGHDEMDTALGNEAADENAATITIAITATVEQVD